MHSCTTSTTDRPTDPWPSSSTAPTSAPRCGSSRCCRWPLLVLHGTHDVSAPLETTGRRASALAPDATLKVYENAGHGLFVTHAEQLTADLREFVTR
ncbi:alpha/beta fold hydrolase [Streptomyces sp. NPDC001663]|uniref:alpha/beta fold hydrolase n=1 Tax=Streptomyces sp. NPDC001663 TaxID=3364597 RepID=UPI00369B8918